MLPQQCNALATAALTLESDEAIGLAIQGLGPGLNFIEKTLRTRLFEKTPRIGDESAHSHAINGLGASVAALDTSQAEKLVEVACLMKEPLARVFSIPGLVTSLAALGLEQREKLFKAVGKFAQNPMGMAAQASAIGGLSRSMDVLDLKQCAYLVEAACASEVTIAGEIAGLGTSLAFFTPVQHGQLVSCMSHLLQGQSHSDLRFGDFSGGP